MAEKRIIKQEGDKTVVYIEGGGLFGTDRRIGEIEKTSIFDINLNSSHVFKPDGLGNKPIQEVDAKGCLLIPLHDPQRFEMQERDGDTTTFGYNTWSKIYEEAPSKASRASTTKPSTEVRRNDSTSGRPSPYSDGFRRPTTVSHSSPRPQNSRRNDAVSKVRKDTTSTGDVLVGIAFVIGFFMILNAISQPSREMVHEEYVARKDTFDEPKLPSMPDDFFNLLFVFGWTAFIGLILFVFELFHTHETLLSRQIHFVIANTLLFPSFIPLALVAFGELVRRRFFKESLLQGETYREEEFLKLFYSKSKKPPEGQ